MTEAPANDLARAQRDYELAMPQIEAHARNRFGRINPDRLDDAVATTIAIGWENWLSAIHHGRNPNEFISSIAEMAVRRVRSGRRFDRQESANDVMSPRAQRINGFAVQPLPDDLIGKSPEPPEQAAFREQYRMLLDGAGPRKRVIIEDMAAGTETQELATRHGVTPGRISQIRREAEQAWRKIDRER